MTNTDKGRLMLLTGALKAIIEKLQPSYEVEQIKDIARKQEEILVNDHNNKPDIIY